MVKPLLIYVKMGKLDELGVFVLDFGIFMEYYPCVLTIMKFNNNGNREKKIYADFESELVQWLTDKVS
jgi:hypothetical protein